MQHKNDYILGLDIGTNSIGWAVVDCEKEPENEKNKGIYAGYKPMSLRALNARIFQDMLDNKTKVPKNQARRAKRGARNRQAYYKKRRKALIEMLVSEGLLPENFQNGREQALNRIDRQFAERKLGKFWSKEWTSQEKAYCSPYAMRHFSLEEKLEPHEFGRLLLHLQRRRGYFSNRGAKYVDLIKHLSLEAQKDNAESMSAEEKKETGKVLSAISELTKELDNRTLGQFIWQKSQQQQIPPKRITLFEFEKTKERKGETVIERLQFRAEREMYEEEFDAIWEKQKSFYKFSDDQAKKIKEKIFHQRPLQIQKNKVGNCNIYPHKKRAALMRLEFQKFRTLQVINNIKINNHPLDEGQRRRLLELSSDPLKLNRHGRISWDDVAIEFGVNKKHIPYPQSGSEDSSNSKTGLIGNKTAQAICHSIGVDTWNGFSPDQQVQLVEDLLTIHNKLHLYQRLVKHWNLPSYPSESNTAKGALGLTMNERLEDGYGKHSLKAINELLPHLLEGTDYYHSVELIGKRKSITTEIKKTAHDFLLKHGNVPNVANPIVQKALYEIRRVVNTIVKRYGKPAIIRIEMAREMKASKKHRIEITKFQSKNREQNETAEKEILDYYKNNNPNIKLEQLRGSVRRVSPKDRQKYKMLKEQDEYCPYGCGKQISPDQLFSGEAEIEHILPYTGFRQNYMNTVISCRSCNAVKGKRTPYETWGADKGRWERIEKFAKSHFNGNLYSKRLRILKKDYQPEDEDSFVTRQLNDTRYIATATKEMLAQYGVPIDVNTGAATAELRRKLGLNNVLPQKPDTTDYVTVDGMINAETGEILQYSKDKAEKKSRQDHRHHAVDAFVIAITDRAMIKAMVDAHQKEQDNKNLSKAKSKEEWIKEKRLLLPKSWQDDQNLHELLRAKLNATVVSHMAKRKVWGSLNEDTRYGKSHFVEHLDISGMTASVLKQVAKIASTQAGEMPGWIDDEELRSMLLGWSQEALELGAKDRSLPNWGGTELKRFNYKVPCITIRKPLDDDRCLKLLVGLNKEWNPGKKTWIADLSVHGILYQWLETNNLLTARDSKVIKTAIQDNPPRIRSKKGDEGTLIKRVCIAQVMTNSYRKLKHSYVKLGSNHHFVLFHNGKEGKERERKLVLVTMLEAASRVKAGKPIIIKTPLPEWEGEWHYELNLCVNDMVKCLDLSIFDKSEKFAIEHKNSPYFRLKSMYYDNVILNLEFQHHSVSGDDKKWGIWNVKSLKNLQCKKVQLGNLGGEMQSGKLVLFTDDS